MFLSSEADIVFYGGQAGGGKTWMLALDPAQDVHVAGFAGVILRRTSPELVGGGSIWEATQGIYMHLGGKPRGQPNLDWRFPSRAIIELRHLQHEKDVYDHQGKQYAFIGFDEVTHFTAFQFWYMVSRLRSTCGVTPRLRATCNPDPDSFVRELVAWWIDPVTGLAIPERSGVIRHFARTDQDTLDWGDTREEVAARNPGRAVLSFTFIPARLIDNPVLLARDPGYVDRLGTLPRVERERLLGGNWNVRPVQGDYFRRSMFPIRDGRPLESEVKRRVRFWDKAATKPSPTNPDPDWTRGVLVSELKAGGFVIEHVESLRGTPAEVEAVIRRTAEHDTVAAEVAVWQDPGQAGVADVERMRDVLRGFRFASVRASKDKQTYAGVWQSQAEGGRIAVVRGPWNEALFNELEAFPSKAHDDQVDAISGAFQLVFDPPVKVQGVRITGR